ncbi:MAG: peptide chain release factor N(5)-glutamine methyltransferase [Syntrophales bacterium]
MTDIRTIIHRTTRDLAACGSASPRLDAEVLLMHLLRIDRLRLVTHPEQTLTEEQAADYARWVERRCQGEPVSYIVGVKEFWSLVFEVNRDVLIPRPETECLIEEVLDRPAPAGDSPRIIDIGTGSGAIGVVLATEIPAAKVAATDVSAAALEVARRNALRHGVADRMELFAGDLFAASPGTFDIICSNPPYIPDGAYPLLAEGIRAFEPRGALIAGPDGTAFHRRIIREGADRLKAGGWMYLEIGEGQREIVEAHFRQTGFYDTIRFRKDYGGIDRIAIARRRKDG